MPLLTYKKQKLMASQKAPAKRSPTQIARAKRATDRIFVPRMINTSQAPKIYRIALKDNGRFTASGAGVVNQVVHTLDPSACTEWASLSALYDQYKVLECWVKMFPTFNNAAEGISSGYAPVVFCYDPDDTTAIASFDIGLHYGNHQVFNVFRPFKYGVRPVIQGDNSVNNAGMALSYRPGYGNLLDIAQAANYQKGIITWYGDGLPAGIKLGEIVIEYFVQFFNRR